MTKRRNSNRDESPIRLGKGTISNGQYNYPEVEITEIPKKGLGVVAKINLNIGFKIPYGGKQITEKEKTYLQKKGRLNYVAKVGNLMYNGDPAIYPENLPKFGWVGSLVNEPGKLEKANSVLKKDKDSIIIELVEDVPSGQEIMIHYNWRAKKGGYERGAPADGAIIRTKKLRASKSTGFILYPDRAREIAKVRWDKRNKCKEIMARARAQLLEIK